VRGRISVNDTLMVFSQSKCSISFLNICKAQELNYPQTIQQTHFVGRRISSQSNNRVILQVVLQVVPVIFNLPCLESCPKHVRDKNSVEVSYNELHSLGEK
jgi:hypothetical protein